MPISSRGLYSDITMLKSVLCASFLSYSLVCDGRTGQTSVAYYYYYVCLPGCAGSLNHQLSRSYTMGSFFKYFDYSCYFFAVFASSLWFSMNILYFPTVVVLSLWHYSTDSGSTQNKVIFACNSEFSIIEDFPGYCSGFSELMLELFLTPCGICSLSKSVNAAWFAGSWSMECRKTLNKCVIIHVGFKKNTLCCLAITFVKHFVNPFKIWIIGMK